MDCPFNFYIFPPVLHEITAALPTSFHVPTIPSPRLAVALPLPDKVISKGFPAVSVTFHLPSNWLAAKQGTPVVSMAKIATRIVLVNLHLNPLGCAGHLT